MKMNATFKQENNLITPIDNLYDAGFDVVEEVTKITADTFTRKGSGLVGKIAYLDDGAHLYEEFKKHHIPGNDPSQSDAAQLITTHKSALSNQISDIERLIVIGGGSYDSFSNQEMMLVRDIFKNNKKAPLKEIVLVDVSLDFLQETTRAANDVGKSLGRKFNIIPLRADFKKVSGGHFDVIMNQYGTSAREDIKAAVIMTGATFANIENISSTDSLPVNDIDVQMATLGEFVGNGSTVMFDHFTQMHSGENYYNQPELQKFFTNIPVIMQKYCKNLYDFQINDDSAQEQIFFSYKANNYWNARLIAHQLIAERPQTARISNGVEKVLTIADRYNVMYSMRPRAEDISNRPSANTGLESNFYVSSKDLVMHVFKKVESDVSALEEHHNIDARAFRPSSVAPHNFIKRTVASFMRSVPRLQPVVVGHI